MAEGYECDRCGSLNSGEPHTMVALGDGIPRRRVRGLHPTDRAEGLPPDEYDEVYDLCPGCRSSFEAWFDGGEPCSCGENDACDVCGGK